MRFKGLLRRALALICAVLLPCSVLAETSQCPAPKAPVLIPPDRGLVSRGTSSGNPVLSCSNLNPWINQTFYLSWNEPTMDQIVLWLYLNGEFINLGDLGTTHSGYAQSFSDAGLYSYCIMGRKGDSWMQSEMVAVNVTADDDTVCAQLTDKGMNNTWNIMFIVYPNVRIGDFQRSFTATQLDALKSCIAQFSSDVKSLSNGLLNIGTTDMIIIDDTITSASGSESPPSLTYGPTGDVDFNYIVDHKDITLAAVYTPLLGLNGGDDWLGLSGTYETINGKRLYTLIINEIYSADYYEMSLNGKDYTVNTCALLHELLHSIETNSRTNGWSGFQPIHDSSQNSYTESEHMLWYHDEMVNTLKSGNQGFKKQSYYVRHYPVASAKMNGLHTDYDGVKRYYISGVPHLIDVILPSSATVIEAAAFQGIRGKSFLIPASVQSIGSNAFDANVKLYGYANSPAETWAKDNGISFTRIPQ